MTYEIYENRNLVQRFLVWATAPNGDGRVVAAFKTRKGAENWIRKHS